MIERKQLFRHDPESGVIGDCYRTALACILDLEPEDFPHVGIEQWRDPDLFNKHFEKHLESIGFSMVQIAWNNLVGMLNSMEIANPGVYYVIGGESRNGCGHVVVACGGEIVWDPAQDNSGLVAPFKEDGLYWATFLVPSRFKRVPA